MQFQEVPFTQNTKPDFIKRFHIQKNVGFFFIKKHSEISNMIILYENQFKIRLSQLRFKKSQKGNFSQDKIDIEQPSQHNILQQKNIQSQQHYRDIYFQTVPYDAVILNKKNSVQNEISMNLIASSRSMPVRIYEFPKDYLTHKDKKSLNYCTFKDNKPNSQNFLSPYEFAVKNEKVIGIGKKFCSLYDCQKIKTTRIKAFDKIHLSTVQLLTDQTTAIIGDFIGDIYFIDLRQQNQKLSDNHFKPHVDAVFHVKPFQNDENLFLSSARKDNFTYLFDRRNLSTFVSFIEFDRNSNQRYGLSIDGDKFGIGTQDGLIYINELKQLQMNQLKVNEGTQNLFQDRSRVNITDLSIMGMENNQTQILYSLGTRFYEEQEQDQEMRDTPKVLNFGLRKFTKSKIDFC